MPEECIMAELLQDGSKFDVLIAGAGPAGTVLAYHLAGTGLRVGVIEIRPWEDLWGKPCGDAVAVHHFTNARLPQPPPEVVRQRVEGVYIYSPDRRTRYRVGGEGYIIDRRRLGQYLLGKAVEKGVELYLQHSVIAPIVKEGAVTGLRVVRPDGMVVEAKAQIVVDATGFVRAVARRFPGSLVDDELSPLDTNIAYREVWVYEDREIEEPEIIRIYLDQELAPGGYWWFFPEGAKRVNIGLGVQGGRGLSPKPFFKRLKDLDIVRGRYKVVEAGGAAVPTRRPCNSMVDNGLIVIGDAAYNVNPVHGGGMGYAFYAAYLASQTITSALERGCRSAECLWSLNMEYMTSIGAKQAALDIFRRFLQRLSNDELNYGMEKRLIPEMDVTEVSSRGELKVSVVEKALIMLRGLKRPSLLRQLKTVADYMKRIRQLYLQYPESPSSLDQWVEKVTGLIQEFEAKLSGR